MILELDLFLSAPGPIFDVRSPGEFNHGRIPGALNLPLFDDLERAQIGTIYKQQSQQAAIELGQRLVQTKLTSLVQTAKLYAKQGVARVHCWRGGMRSAFLAELLAKNGLEVVLLKDGYKTFRRWCLHFLDNLSDSLKILILGGLTGSGKTTILRELHQLGEQIIDLEALANHKGSSFGMLGMPAQPSIEQFENELALKLSTYHVQRPIWIEDESRFIGTCKIPNRLYSIMSQASFFLVERTLDERLEHLLSEYGNFSCEALIQSTKRITKRLGGLATQEAILDLENGNTRKAFTRILSYYDRAYLQGLKKRERALVVPCDRLSFADSAKKIKALCS